MISLFQNKGKVFTTIFIFFFFFAFVTSSSMSTTKIQKPIETLVIAQKPLSQQPSMLIKFLSAVGSLRRTPPPKKISPNCKTYGGVSNINYYKLSGGGRN